MSVVPPSPAQVNCRSATCSVMPSPRMNTGVAVALPQDDGAAGRTCIVSDTCAYIPPLSVTATDAAKLLLLAVGVPVIVPAVETARPGGRTAVAEKVYGAVPPAIATV